MSGRTIRPGDVVVSRVNGTRDVYVIGTVEFRNARQLVLRDPLATSGRASAIGRAHIVRQDDRRVWLSTARRAAYVSA